MKKQVTPTPTPVIVSQVCSVCGENWALHLADDNGNVPITECIRVLRARPHVTIAPTITTPWVPQWPTYPQWTYTTGGTSGNVGTQSAITVSSSAVN